MRARAERPFSSVDDLAVRVRELRKDELNRLAEIGALNSLDQAHRRDALWQTQRAIRPVGPLLAGLEELGQPSPLAPMNTGERLFADYRGTGLTIGKHPMAYLRDELRRGQILSAVELRTCSDGEFVRTAGCVIARQRPGTAMGFVFLSMEDETGIANVIVTPALYERERLIVTRSKFILAEGPLQNQDGVIHVKATRLQSFSDQTLAVRSHDFH